MDSFPISVAGWEDAFFQRGCEETVSGPNRSQQDVQYFETYQELKCDGLSGKNFSARTHFKSLHCDGAPTGTQFQYETIWTELSYCVLYNIHMHHIHVFAFVHYHLFEFVQLQPLLLCVWLLLLSKCNEFIWLLSHCVYALKEKNVLGTKSCSELVSPVHLHKAFVTPLVKGWTGHNMWLPTLPTPKHSQQQPITCKFKMSVKNVNSKCSIYWLQRWLKIQKTLLRPQRETCTNPGSFQNLILRMQNKKYSWS